MYVDAEAAGEEISEEEREQSLSAFFYCGCER